jgi:hypothetical protein
VNTKKRINLAELDENIADMTRTALRIAERDGWNSPMYLAISKDIARFRAQRARIAARRRARLDNSSRI